MKWAALALVALAAAPLSSSAPQGPDYPAMGEHDYVIPIAGGCAYILTYDSTPDNVRAALARNHSNEAWTGDCHLGLANGHGTTTILRDDGMTVTSEGTYLYGRMLWPTTVTNSRNFSVMTYYVHGSDVLRIYDLKGFSIAGWSGATPPSIVLVVSGVQKSVTAVNPECTDALRAAGPFKGCKKRETVYGIEVRVGQAAPVTTPCPKIYDPATCQTVWASAAAPFVAEAQAFIQTVQADNDALRARLIPIFAQWEADAPKRQAAAANAERARQAAAEQQARDAAAAKARADQAFQNSLNTLGAGELFAKADEYRRAGDSDRADQMLRALVRRFPNSPLAGVAAQQLVATGPTSSTRSAPPVASSRPSEAARTCDSYLENMPPSLNAGQTPNEVSNIASAEYLVWRTQEYFRLARALGPSICTPSDFARYTPSLVSAQKTCREYGGRNCEMGADYRPPQYRQASQRVFDQTLAEARNGGGGGMASAAPASNSACSRTPEQEKDSFNADLQNLTRQHPMPGTEAGARATYQYSYAYALRALAILEPRRTCLGRYYQPNYDALVNMRDSAKQGCDQLSSSSAICPKELP